MPAQILITPLFCRQADTDMKKLAAAEVEANEIIKAARDERIQRIADAKQSAQEKLRVIEEEQEKIYNDQKEMVRATIYIQPTTKITALSAAAIPALVTHERPSRTSPWVAAKNKLKLNSRLKAIKRWPASRVSARMQDTYTLHTRGYMHVHAYTQMLNITSH